MLLDTIKRHDANSLMKLASIEGIRQAGYKIPPRIHSVPAIAFDNANVIFGKQVFDYLLLPGRGLLLQQKETAADKTISAAVGQINGEPSAFSLGSCHSDMFSMLEGDDTHIDKVYTWSGISDVNDGGAQEVAYQEDTRTKKELPDINTIREQRQMDLQQQQENHINIAALSPPTSTRL